MASDRVNLHSGSNVVPVQGRPRHLYQSAQCYAVNSQPACFTKRRDENLSIPAALTLNCDTGVRPLQVSSLIWAVLLRVLGTGSRLVWFLDDSGNDMFDWEACHVSDDMK